MSEEGKRIIEGRMKVYKGCILKVFFEVNGGSTPVTSGRPEY
jgi:hypothetical protein